MAFCLPDVRLGLRGGRLWHRRLGADLSRSLQGIGQRPDRQIKRVPATSITTAATMATVLRFVASTQLGLASPNTRYSIARKKMSWKDQDE